MNLLEKLDLESRMIMPGEHFDDNKIFNINFEKANKILVECRKRFFYLFNKRIEWKIILGQKFYSKYHNKCIRNYRM